MARLYNEFFILMMKCIELQLVMHLVAAYFDSQLFPLPHTAPDGRQFSSAHFFKVPATPAKNKKSLIIYQKSINPPHFQLIIGEETYDISRVRIIVMTNFVQSYVIFE